MRNHTQDNNDGFQKQEDLPDVLADSWLAFVRTPNDRAVRNQFASELCLLLRKFLKRGTLSEPLKNQEEDLWQEAIILLYVTLLDGNKELAAATRQCERAVIARQLRRSVSAAIKFSRRKLQKRSAREVSMLHADEEIPEAIGSQHPANFTALHQLPLDAQQMLVLDSVRKAVVELRLNQDSAELIATLIEKNTSQADLAKSLGVTRQAINQRLKPIWRYLQNAINNEEFPLS